ncbi:MAG: hypothetical protein RL325_799 [Planctomycetota bacterium]|jgi:predicted DCC family thiol-disulfide oxidoreductase YuxK
MDDAPTIILFDGVCNLCSGTVRFLVKRDRAARFRFASLQSDAARRICREHGLPEPVMPQPASIVVIADGRALERSDAALAIAALLPFPWPLLGVFRLLPRALRDWAYRIVASNRYRWFGRSDTCMAPAPELRARFID